MVCQIGWGEGVEHTTTKSIRERILKSPFRAITKLEDLAIVAELAIHVQTAGRIWDAVDVGVAGGEDFVGG